MWGTGLHFVQMSLATESNLLESWRSLNYVFERQKNLSPYTAWTDNFMEINVYREDFSICLWFWLIHRMMLAYWMCSASLVFFFHSKMVMNMQVLPQTSVREFGKIGKCILNFTGWDLFFLFLISGVSARKVFLFPPPWKMSF